MGEYSSCIIGSYNYVDVSYVLLGVAADASDFSLSGWSTGYVGIVSLHNNGIASRERETVQNGNISAVTLVSATNKFARFIATRKTNNPSAGEQRITTIKLRCKISSRLAN